ncbi:MAG TPA: tetratricopeptide repeat protein [Pseudoxanthomonas sp.]|nr:tetratricopeptide repeat protein [Pseudoxanthomonas sp.]
MPESMLSSRATTRRAGIPVPRRLRVAAAFCLALPLAVQAAQTPLAPLMAGEYAYQAGQLAEAARWYLEAAEALDGDAALAERATRIAMLANDDAAAQRALRLWRRRAPESAAMRAADAALALREGRLRHARRELQALLRSPDPRGWRYALSGLGGGRDPARVARVLGELVDAGAIPDQLPAWQEFGRLALRLDDPALAERIVDEVVERFPDEPRVAILRAGQLQQAGRTEQARAMLAQAEPHAAADPEVRAMLAMTYESMRAPADAARIMALGPQDMRSYELRASLLARAEDTAGLEALYDELAAEGSRPDPSRRLLLGRIAEFLKRPAEAVEWYRGVPGGPQRNEARIRIAAALHELGRREEAYAEAQGLQDDATADDTARRNAYLLEGELRQRAGDVDGEIDALGRGLAAFPDDIELLYARALAWERRDRIDRAEADLRRLLVSDPENVAALNALGYTLADRTDRYREALELIDRARAAEPDDAAIIDSYGWVLYRLGRHEEALVELRRAWGLMKDPEIGAHLGEVLWVLGRRDEARRYFDEARKLQPDNRALRRALEKLGLPLQEPAP